MRVYTYSDARQHLADVLSLAEHEEVIIKRRDGATFSIMAKPPARSQFDVPCIDAKATTNDVINAVRESRKA